MPAARAERSVRRGEPVIAPDAVGALIAGEVEFRKWREAELGTHLYCGELLGRQFIGWSAFLSNAPLNKAQRAQLARRVGELHRSGC